MAFDVPVKFLCNYFKISRSGYYAWLNRPESIGSQALKVNTEIVKDTFKTFKKRYGSPRIYRQLKRLNYSVCENTVARIMKSEGLIARKKKRFKVVKIKEESSTVVAPRIFKIEDDLEYGVNEIWVRDITYIPVNNKFLYLSVVLDVGRRKIVGWSLDDTLSSEGVTKALADAYAREGQGERVFHSDQGVQYKSVSFN